MTEDLSGLAARFGRVVRIRREALGISQEDLAARAGLHRTYVSLIERGRRTASLKVVEKLADGLQTSMSDLVSGTEAAG